MKKKLLSLGHGYSAQVFEKFLDPKIWEISATTRDIKKAEILIARNINAFIWPSSDLKNEINRASHILLSIPPIESGDPVFESYFEIIKNAQDLEWIGYLSTTGVYGDHDGNWVDENTKLNPTTERGKHRVLAEEQWLSLAKEVGSPVNIFRLAGIYGPGRGPFSKVIAGTAKRIIKVGQVFSRIHVEDIARVLLASMERPGIGKIYNVCDDLPAPPEDVLSYAAKLLNKEDPPIVDFSSADLSDMVRSFYSECKRVDNSKIKSDLLISLSYPNYKIGLKAELKEAYPSL
jgi:nucleoside-diphosphate-sugar epimerase